MVNENSPSKEARGISSGTPSASLHYLAHSSPDDEASGYSEMHNKTRLVSIIIPVFNEAPVIERLLQSLKKQTYKPLEIIVVDDGSVDNTIEIARRYADKLLKRKHAERSIQRNFGVSNSKGKYLLILDADMELTPSVITECVILAENNHKIGAIVIPEESVASNYWGRVKAYERSFYNLEGDEVTDAARFFTRIAFENAGGYDEQITGPEDWDLPETVKSLGYKQGRIRSNIFHYERIKDPISVAKKKYYYAISSHKYLKKQNISPISAKTLFFLRPVFFRNWRRLLEHPLLSVSMFIMLSLELIFGGYGFILGRLKAK